MSDETGRAHPAERQKQRILRLHAIQNDGQPRRWIFRNAELLNLCWKFAKCRIAVAHALADVLRGGQRTGGFVRVKRAAAQIRQKRQHAPRGFVRFQKIEHAAAASDEHRAPRQGMIDGKVKRFPRKLQNARAFVGAERNALGFRQVQRAEKRRRGQPKQRSKEQRRKRMQAEKRDGDQRSAAEGAGRRRLRAARETNAQKRRTSQFVRKKGVERTDSGHRQKSGAHERGGKQPGMQQGVRLKQRQHGEKLQPCDSGEKQQKEPKHGGKQHEPLQPGQLG